MDTSVIVHYHMKECTANDVSNSVRSPAQLNSSLILVAELEKFPAVLKIKCSFSFLKTQQSDLLQISATNFTSDKFRKS